MYSDKGFSGNAAVYPRRQIVSNRAMAALLADALLANQPAAVAESKKECLGFSQRLALCAIGLGEAGSYIAALGVDVQIRYLDADLAGAAQAFLALPKPCGMGDSAGG